MLFHEVAKNDTEDYIAAPWVPTFEVEVRCFMNGAKSVQLWIVKWERGKCKLEGNMLLPDDSVAHVHVEGQG